MFATDSLTLRVAARHEPAGCFTTYGLTPMGIIEGNETFLLLGLYARCNYDKTNTRARAVSRTKATQRQRGCRCLPPAAALLPAPNGGPPAPGVVRLGSPRAVSTSRLNNEIVRPRVSRVSSRYVAGYK